MKALLETLLAARLPAATLTVHTYGPGSPRPSGGAGAYKSYIIRVPATPDTSGLHEGALRRAGQQHLTTFRAPAIELLVMDGLRQYGGDRYRWSEEEAAALTADDLIPIIDHLAAHRERLLVTNGEQLARALAHPANVRAEEQARREASVQSEFPTEDMDRILVDRLEYDPGEVAAWGSPTRRDRRRIARGIASALRDRDEKKLDGLINRAGGDDFRARLAAAIEGVRAEILAGG